MARRQRLTRQQGMRVAEYAAWRRFGHEHHMLFIAGPVLWKVGVLVAAVAGLALLWVSVPHVLLGGLALAAAFVVGMVWFLWTGSNAALQRRMSARAANSERGAGLGWAVACLVLMLAGTGWLSLWSPFA
jgi:hypothetical protein